VPEGQKACLGEDCKKKEENREKALPWAPGLGMVVVHCLPMMRRSKKKTMMMMM
jgi:hypothetical protein